MERYKIAVVPQILVWGDQTYRDGIDIQPDEFYRRLKNAKSLPTTSQVPIVIKENAFHALVERGFLVMGIFISPKLSGTFQSAIKGRDLGAASEKVTIVDSNSTAMAMGFQILAAARAAEQGAGVSDCKSLVEEARRHVGVFIAVDTLEFLYEEAALVAPTVSSAPHSILSQSWRSEMDEWKLRTGFEPKPKRWKSCSN